MKRKLQLVLGIIIGIFLIWLLFKDTNWKEVWDSISSANPLWLLGSLLAILIGFIVRIWRWGYIVNPVVSVSFWHLFSATQIGFLANFVLPARVGEIVRAIALTRSQKIPLAKTLAFVTLDRLTDLFGLVAVFFITLLVFHPEQDVFLPEEMRNLYDGPISKGIIRGTLYSATFVLLFGTLCFFIIIAQKEFFIKWSEKIVSPLSLTLSAFVQRVFSHFAEGMQVLTSFTDLTKASAVSLLLWGLFALSQACIYYAFNISVPWFTPFVVLSLLSVFISIPGPPGFIGPFHAGIVGGLILVNPAINLNTARAIAILAHLFNLIPILIIGIICLSFEHLQLNELNQEAKLTEGSPDSYTRN